MLRIHFFVLIISAVFTLSAARPSNKYLRKAIRETEKGHIYAAKTLYEKALEKEPDNYRANLGMGLLLCELMDNYDKALPYLEKAYKTSGKDTLGDLLYALGKCYHNNSQFEKAISFFDRMKNFEDYEGEIEFQKDIQKRKADCLYALAHTSTENADKWYIVNAGKTINTDMPEYVPVLTPQNELIFTSRRQDDAKEKVSYLDGKYFESMYIAKVDKQGFKDLRRYSLPDEYLNSRFTKNHESVVSMSSDGSKLFTYHNNKIFEINMDQRKSQKPTKLLKTINFDYYQNHAFLTRDGNTLYFTSEAKGGVGGIDIYKATKIKEGEWSTPENIGEPVNTSFDEDAPFITDDGKTMYFASTGHEGYGNFDIYKSELGADGKWGKPVNLGAPINSPAHDIFMIQDSKAEVGYFSSSRPEGYGDMDIYKIIYLDNYNKECPATKVQAITLTTIDGNTEDYANGIEVKIPSNYKILSYEWTVNGQVVESASPSLSYNYKEPGTYTVTSKTIAYCDTCLSPVIACNTLENRFEKAKTDSVPVVVKNNNDVVDLKNVKGQLNSDQLASIGFNMSPVLFDFNKSELRADGEEILKNNVEVLKKHHGLKVEIIGYTDSRGSKAYNEALSERRAGSVKKYLTKSGVNMKQIKFSKGKGFSEPAVDCKDKACDDQAHQQNRRVIFRVYTN
ncbi:MAG: OmpA family protein [Bacteroidetes bacterium]|nr:OmpA family protein [Bacteroidota bacterium]